MFDCGLGALKWVSFMISFWFWTTAISFHLFSFYISFIEKLTKAEHKTVPLTLNKTCFCELLFHNHKQEHEPKWILNGIISVLLIQLNVLWSSLASFFLLFETWRRCEVTSSYSALNYPSKHHKTQLIGIEFRPRVKDAAINQPFPSSCRLFIFNAIHENEF